MEDIKEFSVTEISNLVKTLLEREIGTVCIRGEISGLKIASSGHAYFNLKENLSVIACTCWRSALSRFKSSIADGMEVSATGKITSYSGQSKYQLSIEKIVPAGQGAWMQALKVLHDKLAAEGLFLESRKKPLPLIPERIGIVTSLGGAVIRDIIHRIRDRFPVPVAVRSVSVQGETSASEVSNAILDFNAMPDHMRPKLIIIARGGGSIEDLWSFNEEITVRTIAASKIPIISAIGHETDYTLSDLAADKRAPTPTAAAEFALPVMSDIKYTLSNDYNRQILAITKLLSNNLHILKILCTSLERSSSYLEMRRQKIDELGIKMLESIPEYLNFKNLYFEQIFNSKILHSS
jgi:exodeoxyribonuclease VII large subunit